MAALKDIAMHHFMNVIPAKAGIHSSAFALAERWIPAFAGMTNEKDRRVDGRCRQCSL
jgi:hypothetical protein